MTEPAPAPRYRFGAFEADAATGELRRQGLRVKLNAQPFQVLLMLLERQGELVTREEIARGLWPDGTFVDSDHGVNSALNRIREALGDTASNPRFVETLARRGYRFIAPVEQVNPARAAEPAAAPDPTVDAAEKQRSGGQSEENQPSAAKAADGFVELDVRAKARALQSPNFSAASLDEARNETEPAVLSRILASPQDLPKTPGSVVQTLFVLLQLMYVGFYVGALANLAEIEELFSPLPRPALALNFVIVTAAILIPVRAFVLSAWLFRAPRLREKFLRIWPFLLVFDVLWSLSPFLLLHHINWGLALSCTVLLVYSPFAQRSLVLMGTSEAANSSASAR
jgi:cholera toxin transcriptional activator